MTTFSWRFVTLAAFFVTALVVSNIIAVKLAEVGGRVFDAGNILFPLAYVLGDVLTEVYGFRAARRVILLGFASALRRSELTALTLTDVETRPAGLLLHVRRSKPDPEGHGQLVGVAHEYLDPLVTAGVDTLILGCTHYPLLTGVISYVVGDAITLVSSAEECAKDVYKMLVATDLMRQSGQPTHRFLTTGAPEEFESIGRRFLGPELGNATQFVGGLVPGGLR